MRRRPGLGSILLVLPVWLVLGAFFLGPLAMMAALSLRRRGVYGGVEPFRGLGELLGGSEPFANYLRSIDPLYLEIAGRSLWMAALTTAICLAVSFPAAWWLALRAPVRWKGVLLGLVVVPFWTSFLIRTYAWMFILRTEGLFNAALLGLGWIEQPLDLLYTPLAVMVGLVYGELPFMILPLYASLEKLDRSLLEAAADLGAGRFATLRRVALPLAAPGIAAGVVLVFIPSLGQFVVPDLLGGARTMLVGNLVQNQFTSARNPPFGAALAFELTAAVLLLLLAYALWARRRGGGGEEDLLS